jgi:hypothetical protein
MTEKSKKILKKLEKTQNYVWKPIGGLAIEV